MKNAYASIWRCLMYDTIIEIRGKACVHVHHPEISTQEETFVSHLYREYMKGEEGVWGGGASPPEANRMKGSQIKWKLLLFNESDFFISFEASLFLILF